MRVGPWRSFSLTTQRRRRPKSNSRLQRSVATPFCGKFKKWYGRNLSTLRMEKKSLGCPESPHTSGSVNAALLLQRVRHARPVQVVPNLPGLAVTLLEVAEVGRLHEEVVRRHARDRVVQDTVQDPWASIRLT